MLDLKFVRSHLNDIENMLKNRGYDLNISRFETLDQKRREILAGMEALRHQKKTV